MDEQLMSDPVRRRSWLFAKASENAPLSKALALAQAAEAFITGTTEHSSEVLSAPPFELSPVAEKSQQQMPNLAAQSEQPLATTEELAGLSSMVSLDDVILYLQRGGGVVLAETESADELLARANIKRAEQGLPPFALFPGSPSRTDLAGQGRSGKNVTVPRPPAALRPPNARERAQLARRVIALAAQ